MAQFHIRRRRSNQVRTFRSARRRGDSFWLYASLFGLLSVAFTVWLVIRIDGPRVTDAIDDLGELVAALVAGTACGVASRRLKAARTGWALLSASSFAWAAGEVVWTYYDLGRGIQVPFPSLADLGFLAAVPLAVAGLAFFLRSSESNASHFRWLLDGILIGGSVFLVSWTTVLGPLFSQHQGGVLAQCVSLAYPVSDIVIASLVVIVATRSGTRNRASLGLVLVGMLAFAVADSSFSYLTELDNYGIGTALDSGWVIGYLLVALGAVWAVTHPTEATPDGLRVTRWTVLGPYLPGVMAGAVFLWRVAGGQAPGRVTVFAGLGVVVAMSIRQILVLFENLSLTSRLESESRGGHRRASTPGVSR